MPVGKANQTKSQMASLKIYSVHIGNGIQLQNLYWLMKWLCHLSTPSCSSVESQLNSHEANRHVPTTYSLQKWRSFLWSGPTLVGFELASHLAWFCQPAWANEHVNTSSSNVTWPCQLAYSGIGWSTLIPHTHTHTHIFTAFQNCLLSSSDMCMA
jgi:hypothetical protein